MNNRCFRLIDFWLFYFVHATASVPAHLNYANGGSQTRLVVLLAYRMVAAEN